MIGDIDPKEWLHPPRPCRVCKGKDGRHKMTCPNNDGQPIRLVGRYPQVGDDQ